MTHALVVFSGGLDSILTVKILEEQGIKVMTLSFESYFFDAEESKKTAKQLGIDLIVKDISEIQLDTVKNPAHGHGSALNPCIDCHGLMFRVAGELAELIGENKKFDLIATGEVLGQRPFSQNREALKKVEKLAGIDILRPLSAKLLPKTSYEEQGLVDREKLLDISGKSRRRQLELVKKYDVEYYPSPAGGCRLTENEFGEKVKQLLESDGQNRDLDKIDFELLRIGRHCWLNTPCVKGVENSKNENFRGVFKSKPHIILGKNYEENEQLKKSAKKGDILLELEKIMGPTALIIQGQKFDLENNPELLNETKQLILDRSKGKGSNINEVEYKIKKV